MSLQESNQKPKDVRSGTKGESKPVQRSRDKENAAKSAPETQKHEVKLRSGITSAVAAQDGVSEVSRVVPSGEPSQLPSNDDLKLIGKRITRIDGPSKTT